MECSVQNCVKKAKFMCECSQPRTLFCSSHSITHLTVTKHSPDSLTQLQQVLSVDEQELIDVFISTYDPVVYSLTLEKNREFNEKATQLLVEIKKLGNYYKQDIEELINNWNSAKRILEGVKNNGIDALAGDLVQSKLAKLKKQTDKLTFVSLKVTLKDAGLNDLFKEGFTDPMTLLGHCEEIWSLAFSSDGEYLASSSGDKTIKIWDTSTGENIRTLSGHNSTVYSIVFSPNDNFILSGGRDKATKL